MIARLGLSTLWLLAGAAITGGVYWGFLNTPESSIGALILSTLLVVATIALVAVTLNGAVCLWTAGWSREVIRRSIARIPASVPPLILVFVIWFLVSTFRTWVNAHRGEINAVFIARFGWADVAWLFTTLTWSERWLTWIFAPFLALSLLTRSSLSIVRLALASVWFVLLVAVPWIYLAPWRPRGLPATSIELAFIAAKLSITFVLMAIGLSMFVREVVRTRST